MGLDRINGIEFHVALQHFPEEGAEMQSADGEHLFTSFSMLHMNVPPSDYLQSVA
jgi:hypothetical protein